MRLTVKKLVLCLLLASASALGAQQASGDPARALLAMANEARRSAGAPPLAWDASLASAALAHCQIMAAEGPIAHRYRGEADPAGRAAAAGAHFSLIEENVAAAASAERVQDGWMNSPEHRENLLNPAVDRVGIAVVERRGFLYAVADYERYVEPMGAGQVEERIATLVRGAGVSVRKEAADARAVCALERGLPASLAGGQPEFVMRWENSDLTRLPEQLLTRLASGKYRRAAV